MKEACGKNSNMDTLLANNGLDLRIQSLALCSLAAHRAKTGDAKLLARNLAGVHPLLQSTLGEVSLGPVGPALGHDLAGLALDQRGLGQTTLGLHFPALEDLRFRELALANLAGRLLHRFLGFHGLHDLHGLHRQSHHLWRNEKVGASLSGPDA